MRSIVLCILSNNEELLFVNFVLKTSLHLMVCFKWFSLEEAVRISHLSLQALKKLCESCAPRGKGQAGGAADIAQKEGREEKGEDETEGGAVGTCRQSPIMWCS